MRTIDRRNAVRVIPALVLALLCSLLILSPRPARALDTGSITLDLTSITPLGGGLYSWTYTASLTNNSGLSPGSPPTGTSSYVTIYDVFGLVPNSGSTTAVGWSPVNPDPLVGYTDPGLVITESGTTPNVEFDYTGVAFKNTSGSTITLGTFSFTSTYFLTQTGQYTSRDDKLSALGTHPVIGNGKVSDALLVPAVPAPNAAAIMFMALGSGMGWLRMKRHAAR
jgi:hypothetical protein